MSKKIVAFLMGFFLAGLTAVNIYSFFTQERRSAQSFIALMLNTSAILNFIEMLLRLAEHTDEPEEETV